MTTTLTRPQSLWHNRWSKPSRDDLLEPITEQHRKALQNMLRRLDAYDNVKQSLVWYGHGWHWTLQFDLEKPEQGGVIETLCYLVPKHEAPEVCIPLTAETLGRLSLRRLHKFVRNGVRISKQTVENHWATWNLTASSEAEQLMELINRKYRSVLEPYNKSKKSKTTKTKATRR